MGRLGEHLSRPLVQALARCTGHHKRPGMYLRRDAKHESARRRFFRLAAHGLAVGSGHWPSLARRKTILAAYQEEGSAHDDVIPRQQHTPLPPVPYRYPSVL